MGSAFVWDVNDLAPGAGGVITVAATASITSQDCVPITNRAAISTNAPEANTQNNVAEITAAMTRHRLFLPVVARH